MGRSTANGPWRSEPAFRELLDDPILTMVMVRDGVTRDDLVALRRVVRRGYGADSKTVSPDQTDAGR